jgi:tetratricopeptide (TPR) repeat protein
VSLDNQRSRRGNDSVHPDAERLAEYVDGVLPPTARRELERHLADCADCRQVVADVTGFVSQGQAAGAPSTARPIVGRRWVTGVLAGLATAALVVFAVGRLRVARNGNDIGTAALLTAAAAEPTRAVEGRLVDFGYAPAPPALRGDGTRRPSPDVQIAAARIQKAAIGQEGAAGSAALGVAYAWVGDVDNAVDSLKRAVAIEPGNGRYQNDLSAVYLTRARLQSSRDDYANALTAAERAAASRGTAAEGCFNRALALEGLARRNDARSAWESCLTLDAGSPWAREMQDHLRRLQP